MTIITITGNATSDPELTFAQSGTALARFTVAVSKREKQPDGTWGDGATAFYRVTAFQSLAEQVDALVMDGIHGQARPAPQLLQARARFDLNVVHCFGAQPGIL